MTDIAPASIKIGMFGDSYISPTALWIHNLREKDPRYDIHTYGMGGSNLYYAIHTWQQQVESNDGSVPYDIVFFTLTWHERLFSIYPYRNSQFCATSEFRPFEPDCEIKTSEDNQQFLQTIELYRKYIYDDHWRRFDHELEIAWIMDLPSQYPQTKFVIVPNTELGRTLAKKYHCRGVLLDMAFETVSNQEPGNPGLMPVADWRRCNHLNQRNHEIVADLMHETIRAYDRIAPGVVSIDMTKFDRISDAS